LRSPQVRPFDIAPGHADVSDLEEAITPATRRRFSPTTRSDATARLPQRYEST